METQTINQAVSRLEAMPKAKQQEIFNFIDFVYSRNTVVTQTEKSKQKALSESAEFRQRFLAWRKSYEAMLDDGWTDADHDAVWDNVRDKNDTGRDVIFGE